MRTKLNYLLMLLAMMMVMPQGVNGQTVDGLTANQTFDFVSLAQQSTTINWGGDYTGFTDNSPKYMGDINGTSLEGRFATGTKSGQGWFLRTDKTPFGLWGRKKLAFCGMWNGDRVRVTLAQGGIRFLEANSAKMNGSLVTEGQTVSTSPFVFAAARDGDVIIECTDNYTTITKVEFFNSDNNYYGNWTVSFNTSSVSLEGGQTYDTNNANVTPNWVTPTFTSSNNRVATVDEKGVVTAHRKGTATITARMDVGPEGNQWAHHATAEMTVNVTSNEPVVPKYNYDPAIEIYDLSGINTGSASLAEGTTGYNLNGSEAHYLANPSSYSLNNRLTASQTDFIWANGLKTNLSNNQWRILAINGLVAGDRVVITYSGTTMEFGSNSTDQVFSAAGIVFKDDNNNGEREDDEPYLQGGNQVESGMIYTMEQDGHLDIRVPGGAVITKIEIYGDHQATMEDRYNGSAATGYTAYFSSTGQLIAKEHIVPGGLEVHVGNEAEEQHAIVVSSDRGPVSFVYDQGHYKMARQSDNGSNITAKAPATGTFYKFMPEVDGYLTVNFKAYNIKYNNYQNGNGLSQGNEVVATSGTCPYYIMVKDVNNNFGRYVHPNGTTQYAHDLSTGDNDKFENIRVTAGNTYYVYGWWSKDPQGLTPGTEGWNLGQSYCGVAQLIDVTFIPDNMVTPLAKWVDNSKWVASSSYVEELADVTGFSTNDVRIKMKSANITGCTAYIENNKLKITGVTFAEGTNPGGTILIKLGDPSNDSNPVFAYTIAYDASFNMPEGAVRSEGHTWDFSTNSLKGLKWNSTSSEFEVKDFKKADDTSGLLYDEMHETNPDGSAHSDWTKTWRVINSSGQGTHDLMFLNKYDMEGDNADMMWDTEGLIFNTASNQSCINNEFGGVVDHGKTGTQTDPDRYVGILPGGSFTIPALKAGDRVEIFMGSGEGSGGNACKLNITNALDAIGNPIDPTDIYNGGGSVWKYNAGNESRYRGAYQFISTGGDMTFTMNGGSMTKLYTIMIYRGAKTATVDCTRQTSVTYNNDVYDGYTYSFNNDWRTTTPAKTAIALHYRGKGERLRTPTVVHQSGNVSTGSDNLFYDVVGDNNAPYIFYKSKKEDYGMFRMRVEDLELGNKYVADYALQNITVGYLEKKNYPYTWDFTDLLGYVETDARILGERTNVDGYDPRTIDENEAYEIEFMNNSVGEDVKAVEQWKEYDADGDIPAGYGLQINNEPYSGGCMWTGGQLYAGDQPFGETYFLSIKVPESLDNDGKLQPDINKNYNGGVRICDEGLCLTGGNWTITLPQVSTDAAVYIRAHQVGTKAIYAAVGDVKNNASFTYEGTATDGTKDKIYAIKGTGEDMKLMFNNLIIKKIAVSTDPKTVNAKGWATESRARVIDPTLTSYMTGKDMRTYIVTGYNFPEKQVTLMRVDDDTEHEDFEGYLVPVAANGDDKACIIRNFGGEKVKILNDGFHLFIPDMHDSEKKKWNEEKKIVNEVETDEQAFNNLLVSQLSPTNGTNIPYMSSDGVYTNYAFSCTYYDINPETADITNNTPHTGDQAFYRIASGGATSNGNQAYLPILVPKKAGSRAAVRAAAASESAPVSFGVVIKNRSSVLFDKGDVNGDGRFNKLDVNAMADHLAGRPAGVIKSLADMNGDGSIDIVDLTLMIKVITGE